VPRDFGEAIRSAAIMPAAVMIAAAEMGAGVGEAVADSQSGSPVIGR
jgi:hypothetical protein